MIITAQYILLFVLSILCTAITLILDLPAITAKSHSVKFFRNVFALLLLAFIILMCIANFMNTLTLLVASAGIIGLIDMLFFSRKRAAQNRKQPLIVEYARSFFFVLCVVWVIRSFIVQPYRVPTGSLEPTIMPGDFIAVNQFAYGLRFPFMNQKLVNVGEPKVGDIALFYYPINPEIVYVKRVIGTPGDHVQYKNKVLYINGKEAKQTDVGPAHDVEPAMVTMPQEDIAVERKVEDLNGIKHEINVRKSGGETLNFDITVPKGMYFMMGDNRDDSEDSRIWGFVPEHNLIGKAFWVFFNWDPINHKIQFNRIGKLGKGVPQ